jgi:PleD family two-component response regulator
MLQFTRAAQPLRPQMISEPLLHKMKILVIDDDQMTVSLIERFLQRKGYSRLLGITDSGRALETCAEFNPDLILLDLIMPNIDGFALLEQLRSDGSETFLPIIVLTADTSEDAKARALDAGATDFLVKPVSPTEALLRIRNLLETRRLNVVLENQRSALQDAVRDRTVELRETIAELQILNQRLQGSTSICLAPKGATSQPA